MLQGANLDVALALGDLTRFSHPGTNPLISLVSGLEKSAGDRGYKWGVCFFSSFPFSFARKAGFRSSFQPGLCARSWVILAISAPRPGLQLPNWVIYATHQQSSQCEPDDLVHNVKFKGYSCTDALHFSPGTAVSKMLPYSDEGPMKGQIEICLHIWTNICEQFSPLFSKLYVWPVQWRSVVLFKYIGRDCNDLKTVWKQLRSWLFKCIFCKQKFICYV